MEKTPKTGKTLLFWPYVTLRLVTSERLNICAARPWMAKLHLFTSVRLSSNWNTSNPSSLDPQFPSLLLADGEIISTGLHSDYRPYVNLINGRCGFDDEERSWDGVKSLYRQ